MFCNVTYVNRKLLIGEMPTLEDLEGIDYCIVKSLDMIRKVESTYKDNFVDIMSLNFTTQTSDDRIVELVPDGTTVDVTFDNRHRYCDMVVQVCDTDIYKYMYISI